MLTKPHLDLDFVRAQYPANHWQWAFFESAGGAFVPNSVVQRISAYMAETRVQPGYPFPESSDAAERINSGHTLMAEFVGAEPDEISITASTSFTVYVLAQALRHQWQVGDEIIVATLNHEANSGPWRCLAEFGLTIIEWPPGSETVALDPDGLDQLLNERTRLVAFPHVSNITGTINDVKAITEKVHAADAMVCVDGVAYAPHRAMRVKDWDVDFYLFSFYKLFGPHLGCLYGKRERLQQAKGQYHYFFEESDLAHKMNPAGPNHESIASLVGIADYFDALYSHHFDGQETSFFRRTQLLYGLIAGHEQILAEKFLDFVNSNPDIRLVGSGESQKNCRVPTFSLVCEKMASKEIALAVARDKVAISHGHFYAKRLLDNLQISNTTDGVVRCSMAHYNTSEEVKQLTCSLDRILASTTPSCKA